MASVLEWIVKHKIKHKNKFGIEKKKGKFFFFNIMWVAQSPLANTHFERLPYTPGIFSAIMSGKDGKAMSRGHFRKKVKHLI